MNCQNLQEDGNPCNQCDSCKGFNEGRSLNIFELDAASNNSVEDIRSLIEQLRYPPQSGNRVVYIIDEVHMLSQSAFNAFLKTLEEPPAHALFILATTEKHKILPTILSRCQKFDFRRIGVNDIVGNLENIAQQEQIDSEKRALQLIARKADGGMRDALSIFDQIANFGQGKVTYQSVLENLHELDTEYYFTLTERALLQDHPGCLQLFQEITSAGFDSYNFIAGLLEHLRNLLVAQTASTLDMLELPDEDTKRYQQLSQAMDPEWVINALNMTAACEASFRNSLQPRLQAELLLVKLAYLADALKLAEAQGNGTSEKKSLSQ